MEINQFTPSSKRSYGDNIDSRRFPHRRERVAGVRHDDNLGVGIDVAAHAVYNRLHNFGVAVDQFQTRLARKLPAPRRDDDNVGLPRLPGRRAEDGARGAGIFQIEDLAETLFLVHVRQCDAARDVPLEES